MAAKKKKRVFSKEHREKIAASARARYAKPGAKKRGRPSKANVFVVDTEVKTEVINSASPAIGQEPKRMVTNHEMAMDVVFSSNDQQVKALALQILSGSNY